MSSAMTANQVEEVEGDWGADTELQLEEDGFVGEEAQTSTADAPTDGIALIEF